MSSTDSTNNFIKPRDSYETDRKYGEFSFIFFIAALALPLICFMILYLCLYKYRRKHIKANCQT